MEEEDEAEPPGRWRCPEPLPKPGKLRLVDRPRWSHGQISIDLFTKVFRPSGDNQLDEDGIFFVSVTPWCLPTPEPERACHWTIVAVRRSAETGEGATIELPENLPALSCIRSAFANQRPDVSSLQGVDILVQDVQPLALQRVFVRLDGNALRKHAEVQEKFGGGFLPASPGGTAPSKASERALLATTAKGLSIGDGEIGIQLRTQIENAVRESLGRPIVAHCDVFYPLPLPTHPITHVAFPPIEVIICEPVDQGLIVPQTEIVVDVYQQQERPSSKDDPGRRASRALTGQADGVASTKQNSLQVDGGATDAKKSEAVSSPSVEPAEGASSSDEEETSSDSSDDGLISLSSQVLPQRVVEHGSPDNLLTPRLGPQRSGTASPGSVFTSFTATTANQQSHLGRPFVLRPLSGSVPDHVLHPRPPVDEDDEARAFIEVKLLSRLGCFSGDWVRIFTNPRTVPAEDDIRSLDVLNSKSLEDAGRAVKVYGLPGLSHLDHVQGPETESRRITSGASAIPFRRPFPTAWVSPVLYANLGQPQKISMAPLTVLYQQGAQRRRRRISSSAWPPVASEIKLLRLPTPLSTEKVTQPGILASLKEHFERRRRIVKAGDRIAVAFDVSASRIVASMSSDESPNTDFTDLLLGSPLDGWRQRGPVGVVWYQISHASSNAPTQVSTDPDPAIWTGTVCIESEQTKMVQVGSECSREPGSLENPWQVYLGKQPQQVDNAARASIFQSVFRRIDERPPSNVHRRLSELLLATTSPQAEALSMQPLLILLSSTQRGAGKTYNASAACAGLGLHLFQIDAWDVLTDGGDGNDVKTEATLRAKTDRALTCGGKYTVPLIRHIEAITADRIASALEEILKDFRCIILTTRELGKVSDNVRSLVTHELEITAPDEGERKTILQEALRERGIAVAPTVDIGATARKTAAVVAGDLANIVDRAIIARRGRLAALSAAQPGTLVRDILVSGGAAARCLTAADLDEAAEAARKSFADAIGAPKIPTVTWDDVGGLGAAKHAILETIQLPLEHPELFAKGLKKRSGILLYGPPGTGKTLLAKAIATSFALNFFSVKGPELLNMYIGESEANVRRVFARARDARPCVVFFDELDAVAPKRGNQGDSGGVMDRIVSQLLAELDGMTGGGSGGGEAATDDAGGGAGSGTDRGGGVFVVGATNRPDLLDPALLRPGRFDKMLYLGVAETHAQQAHILAALTRRFALAEGVRLARVAERLPFTYTGADLYALCADALLKAMMRRARAVDAKIAALPGPKITPAQFFDQHATEEDLKVLVTDEDFRAAQAQLVTSVSAKELEHYQRVRKAFESSSIDTSGEPGTGAVSAGPSSAQPGAGSSHPPKLLPAMPLPTRRRSSPAQTRTRPRQSSVQRGKRPVVSRHGGSAHDDTDESDVAGESSEGDDDDDDDEAYVTSNDYATTPERRGARAHSAGPASWKGKGKARATPVGGAGSAGAEGRDASLGFFRDAADGEDLYGGD